MLGLFSGKVKVLVFLLFLPVLLLSQSLNNYPRSAAEQPASPWLAQEQPVLKNLAEVSYEQIPNVVYGSQECQYYEKFSSFLGIVDSEAIDDSFRQKVSGVVGSLLNEVRSAVSSGTPDANGALEALAYSQGIANGLERVGANEEVIEKLRALGEHSQAGTLYEYVRADSIGLLKEPDKQQFGPSQWQTDATPEYLRTRWGEVLEIVNIAKENPDGAEMFSELTEKAKISLAAARADLEEIKKEGNYGEGYGDGFPAVFDETEKVLAKLSEPIAD